jgi:hypothetical protein
MKKFGFVTLLITAGVVFTLAFPVSAAGPKSPAAPATPMAAAPVPASPAPAEEHPHIRAALESMRQAKQHMEAAPPVFEGHREKAIEHLNQAIHEAEICMSMKEEKRK